jgi:hypothetical protein
MALAISVPSIIDHECEILTIAGATPGLPHLILRNCTTLLTHVYCANNEASFPMLQKESVLHPQDPEQAEVERSSRAYGSTSSAVPLHHREQYTQALEANLFSSCPAEGRPRSNCRHLLLSRNTIPLRWKLIGRTYLTRTNASLFSADNNMLYASLPPCGAVVQSRCMPSNTFLCNGKSQSPPTPWHPHTHTHTHTVQYNGCVTGGLFTKKRRGNRVGARRYQLPRPGNPLEVSDSQSSCKPRTHTRTHTSRHPWATLDSLDKWKIDFPGGPTISNRYIPRVLFMYARVEEYNCQRTVAFPIHQRHRRPSSVPLRLSLCSHTYTTTSIVPERSS